MAQRHHAQFVIQNKSQSMKQREVMFGEGFCNLSHKIQLLYLCSEVKNTLFNMVTTGQEMATGKNIVLRSREFHFELRKIYVSGISQRKVKSCVNMNSFILVWPL